MSTDSPTSASVRRPTFSFPRKAGDAGFYPHEFMRRPLVLLDRALRRSLGIYEFSANPACLLRISITRVQNATKLPEDCTIRPSDPIIDLHFWNEHVESLLAGRGSCVKGRLVYRHLQCSMTLLAAYLLAHPEIPATTIHARVVMPLGSRFAQFQLLAESCGFSITVSPVQGMARVHDFFESFWIRGLLWVFNPGPAKRRQLQLCRAHLWMDRSELISRYFPRI